MTLRAAWRVLNRPLFELGDVVRGVAASAFQLASGLLALGQLLHATSGAGWILPFALVLAVASLGLVRAVRYRRGGHEDDRAALVEGLVYGFLPLGVLPTAGYLLAAGRWELGLTTIAVGVVSALPSMIFLSTGAERLLGGRRPRRLPEAPTNLVSEYSGHALSAPPD